jgi:hypothetical protein
VRTNLDRRDAAFAGGALIASFCLQFSFAPLVGSDGYFHVRAAERVLGGGMPWMPYSVFTDGWVDHQLLFHLLMAPFAWLLDGVTAAKAAAATFAAAAAFAMWRLLRTEGVPVPAAFAVLPFAVSWLFLLRMEMPRTQSLSLALLTLAVGALAADRPRLLLGIAALYMGTYHVALGLLGVAVVHMTVVALQERRLAWKGPLAIVAGLGAGLTFHPHFPRTYRFVWQHVVEKVGNQDALPVGLEWTDGGVHWFAGAGLGGAVALVAAAALMIRAPKRSRLGLTLGVLAAGATVAVLGGSKFLEYSVPLSFLALGIAVRDAGVGSLLEAPRVRGLLAAATAVGLVFTGASVASKVVQSEPHPNEAAGAAAFLRTVAEPGDAIFHFHWNDFPELVFHAPEFTYVVGLDPHFLYLHDPERWRLYEALGAAYAGRRSQAIRETFGAKWAVVRLPHPGAVEALAGDPGLIVRFDDGEFAVVYEVLYP